MSSNSTQLPFQAVQAEFAAHIRDPDSNKGPSNIEPRRLAVYKRLFYDNIESFCARTFKAFRALADDMYWHSLIRSFIKSHRCSTPYFREIPSEFLQFLIEREESEERYPFMIELCHFDLVRIELYFAPESIEGRNRLASLDAFIQRSPLVRLLSYQWPVHKIDEDFEASGIPAEPTWLIAYRDRKSEVEFLVSNPRTFRMLEILEQPQPCRGLIQKLAEELKSPAGSLDEQAYATLKSFVRSGVVVLANSEN